MSDIEISHVIFLCLIIILIIFLLATYYLVKIVEELEAMNKRKYYKDIINGCEKRIESNGKLGDKYLTHSRHIITKEDERFIHEFWHNTVYELQFIPGNYGNYVITWKKKNQQQQQQPQMT